MRAICKKNQTFCIGIDQTTYIKVPHSVKCSPIYKNKSPNYVVLFQHTNFCMSVSLLNFLANLMFSKQTSALFSVKTVSLI